MTKFVALLAAILTFGNIVAQRVDEVRPAALGVSFTLTDFETAQRIRNSSLALVLKNDEWAKLNEMSPGIAVSYYQGLTRHIDFASTLAGSFLSYPFPNRPMWSEDKLLLALDASAQLKMVSERYWFQPYLTAGIGAHKYRVYYGAFLPVGVGLNIDLFNEAKINIQSRYHIPVTNETANYHFFHSIGVAGRIGKRKEVPAPVPEAPKDSDNDGIFDPSDSCVFVPGVAKYNGCPVPDTDKDGINDEEDKCPTVPGLAKYQGCPVPDTDNDGINDEEDKCPTVPGVARYEGCPVPDTDNDGINDEEDKCPTVPGVASQQGCPEITEKVQQTVTYAAQNVYFATASTKLLSRSFAPLNEVVTVLQENPSLKLKIDGHTDSQGADDYNMRLSEGRAASVKAYLVSKGIEESRLESEGFGETQPVADNKTAAGRQKNRRVEMKVFY